MTVRRVDRGFVRTVPGGHAHLATRDDTSPVHRTYPTGYDGRCGWCWLNATHTQDAHTSEVSR